VIYDNITFETHLIYFLKTFYNFLKTLIFRLFNKMRLGTYKYCNIVSFDMDDAIFPVNPLEDNFLVAFPNIILEDN